MRQFTTPDQTAKLIELGFEKPKSVLLYAQSVDCDNNYGWKGEVKQNGNYSIGELIDMLPLRIAGNYGIWYYFSVFAHQTYWRVAYTDDNEIPLIDSESVHLIDALHDMILRLKEDGVI